jgi:integrase
MFLSKSKSGIYYLYFTGLNGKRQKVSTRFSQKRDAMEFFRSFRPDMKSRLSRVMFSGFVGDFLSYAQSSFAEQTILMYRSCLGQFLRYVGDIPLQSFTAKHLDDYKGVRLKEVKPVSVNIEVRQIKAAFQTAARWKLLEQSPFADVNECRVPNRAPIFFTKDDFECLLAIVKESWLKELIIFAVLTGMRRGEILNLTWDKVDLVKRLINIESGRSFRTKFDKRRTVPISDGVCQLLLQKVARAESEYVFLCNGRQIKEDHLAHIFKRYVRRARLDEKLHFHSLRNSFASWLAADGVSIYAISKLLGHSSVKTTQDYYAHLQPEHLHETVNRLSVSMN